jgi:actin-related protein
MLSYKLLAVNMKLLVVETETEDSDFESDFYTEIIQNMSGYSSSSSKSKNIILKEINSYYLDNKEKVKEYYLQNKERIIQRTREYQEKNKDEIAQKRKDYDKQRYLKKKQEKEESHKIYCDCGCMVSKENLVKHKTTKKHLTLLQKSNNSLNK